MLWNFIVDHVPAWVYMVVAVLGAGALFYFFSPILVPIWNMMPTWLKVLLGGMGAAFIAWIAGRNRGRANAEEEERRKNAEALRKRTEVDTRVDKMDKTAVDHELDKWRRD